MSSNDCLEPQNMARCTTGVVVLKAKASYSWLYRLRLILGIKYTVVSLILVFYTSFSLFFGILEGLFRVIWYLTTPLVDPVYSCRYSEQSVFGWSRSHFWCSRLAFVSLLTALLEVTSSASINCNWVWVRLAKAWNNRYIAAFYISCYLYTTGDGDEKVLREMAGVHDTV